MQKLPIPDGAILLVVAAVLSDVLPGLTPSIHAVEWIATAALVVILFDGGASIGLRRIRAAAVPVVLLGLPGTFATAGLITVFAHWALGIEWMTAGLIGAAVAPTDPAVMFSVLGDREIEGRTDTILEGESGANDPVGIALMLGLIELATHADETFWVVVRVFALQMGIGLVVGIVGGLAEARLLPRLGRSAAWISLAFAACVFGVAALTHGSGFLAVFVAGLIRGDVEAPRQAELLLLRKRLATVAEVVVFVALGLTIEISGIEAGRWAEGLLIAAFAALLARPAVCAAFLARVRLELGERVFVAWGGLKGAVPILLAALAVGHHVDDAQRIYETVFVVVLASVIVQGSSIPLAARALGVEATPLDEPSASGQ
jgi:cell volume regulation protein A